jgi:hypothetical protein
MISRAEQHDAAITSQERSEIMRRINEEGFGER